MALSQFRDLSRRTTEKPGSFREPGFLDFDGAGRSLYKPGMQFRWIEWNIDHASRHGCLISEIESIIAHPQRGFPRKCGSGKLMTIGRGRGGRMVEVVYTLDDDGTAFVIHAMPLTVRRRRS